MKNDDNRGENLLIKLKSGDLPAFTYFYNQYSLAILRRFKHMVAIEEVAEELLQDLFLKVWERKEQIDVTRSFQAYLYKIAENMIYDHYRRLKRDTILYHELLAAHGSKFEDMEMDLQAKEVKRSIEEAIAALPTQQRKIFQMCKIEGKSYEEVSVELGISVATINTHISRGTKKVKDYLLSKDNFIVLWYTFISLISEDL